jgi:ribosomal protein L2
MYLYQYTYVYYLYMCIYTYIAAAASHAPVTCPLELAFIPQALFVHGVEAREKSVHSLVRSSQLAVNILELCTSGLLRMSALGN